MITREKVCVGCPREMGCAGNACPQGYIIHWFCDNCGMEFPQNQLRRVDEGDVLCVECLGEYAQGLFPIPDEDDYDENKCRTGNQAPDLRKDIAGLETRGRTSRELRRNGADT